MSKDFSLFDFLTRIVSETLIATGIAIFAVVPVFAKTPQEIAKLAESVTVQINGKTSAGTGFIVAKQGNNYTVLTANHVVADTNSTYIIRSSTGKNYQITRSVLLKKGQNAPDLAVVIFQSTESYPVVTLGDSEQATVGTEIFVFGYPGLPSSRKDQPDRNFEFSPGYVTSRLSTDSDGYTLRYNAVTRGGMSGGPVFDAEGRVIGVHGEGDRDYDYVTDVDKKVITGSAITKTGFNSAIPINTFIAKLSETGLNRSALLVNTSTTTNAPLRLNSPNNAKTYYVRGLSRFDKGDLSGAVKDFTEAIQTQSDYPEAYFYRGLAYFDLRQMQKSIADYSQAIALNTSYVDAYYNRGLVLSEMGDKLGAIADYTQVIRQDNTFAQAYNNRGVLLSELGDQKQAIDDFNQALEINPGGANTYFNRGLALFRINNDRSALADYTQAIQLFPNYAKAYANRGITLLRMGDRQGAIADLQQASYLFRDQGMETDAQKALDMINQLQN